MAYPLLTEAQFNDFLARFQDEIVTTIQPYLGVYEILNSSGQAVTEVNSIAVEPPPSKTKFKRIKPDSGIEVIIDRQPDTDYANHLGLGTKCIYTFKVTMTQYKINSSGISLAIAAILQNKNFIIEGDPRTRKFQENDDGTYFYEQCCFKIQLPLFFT